jgi:GT2 family glycosyltransferase
MPTDRTDPASAPGPDPREVVRDLGDELTELTAPLDTDAAEVAAFLEQRRASAPDLELDPELDEPDVPRRAHRVTAVLVAHDGAPWLPATLTALADSTRRPDRVLAVDTGSVDATSAVLERAAAAGVVDRVLTLPRDTSFGAAVAAALATGSGTAADSDRDVVHWVWLLHDDSAPRSGALDALLLRADIERSAGVLGPKIRGWAHQERLLEVGVTVARSGDRVTGLERRELDQGQHDGTRDVLAVSSAGMLVRRDVWERLDEFDPALPMFRDDVDLCWRAQLAGHRVVVATDAVVHHRLAASSGRRPVDVAGTDPDHGVARLDRAAAVHLLRAHSHGPRAVLTTVRLLVGSLLRALGLLLGKAPDLAGEEWGAFVDALRDRGRVRASRSRVAAAAAEPGAVPEADVRRLLAPRGSQLRSVMERLRERIAAGETPDAARSVLDSTTDDPDGWYADDTRPSRLRAFVGRPGTLLVLVLVLAALVGVRGLLGEGVLLGGALLPAPEGAGDLWSIYTAAWHEVGPGSAADAPAWLVPLALLATVLLGSATAAVSLLLLATIPLAGLSAYLALRGVLAAPVVRVWAAATYATLPAITGAMSGGRIGTAATLVLLPVLARSAARLVGAGRRPTWRRAFGTGLLLAVVASFTPVVWLLAVLAAVVGMVLVATWQHRAQLLTAVVLPVALLVPWSLRVVREPALLWLEPGLVGPTDPVLDPLDVLLVRPGGPGSTPLWLAGGLLVAAVVALLLPGRRRSVLAAWAVGLLALAVAVVQVGLRVTPDALTVPVAPWPGVTTAVWGGALVVAAALAADQVPRLLAGADFGWRQPAAFVLAVGLLVAPVGALLLVVVGVDPPLTRGTREVVPAFVAADMRGADRPRALVLRREAGRVVYDLRATPDAELGEIDVAAPRWVGRSLDEAVALMAAGIGADEVEVLATLGVRYVVLADARGTEDRLVGELDGEPGLRRLSTRDGDALWQVEPTSSRAQAIAPATPDESGTVQVRRSEPVPTTGGDPRDPTRLATPVPAGVPDRQLVLAETLDGRWRWTVDGEPVTAVPRPAGTDQVDLATQQVLLPETASTVTASFDGASRRTWLIVQAVLVLLVLIAALPARRRVDVDPDSDDPDSDDPSGLDPARVHPASVDPAGTRSADHGSADEDADQAPDTVVADAGPEDDAAVDVAVDAAPEAEAEAAADTDTDADADAGSPDAEVRP